MPHGDTVTECHRPAKYGRNMRLSPLKKGANIGGATVIFVAAAVAAVVVDAHASQGSR
jgi:hypothetical protein